MVTNLVIVGVGLFCLFVVIVGAVGYAIYSGTRSHSNNSQLGAMPRPGVSFDPVSVGAGGAGLNAPGRQTETPPPVGPVQLSDTRPLIGPPLRKGLKKSSENPPVAPDGTLPRTVLDRVKSATVFIRVMMTDSKGMSGSGFFGGNKDLILTNAHVVGMKQSDVRPKQIDIVMNSGESNEVTFSGEVLTVDRASDLAVLRIRPLPGKSNAPRPEPLTMADSVPQETQQVFIFGFPLGEQLGKSITVAKSSVSSLRKDPEGRLDQIQVNGGMHHGNSGGPVVDAAGNLIGVAVAGIEGTQINFAVPAERVGAILDGRLGSITTGEPQLRGDQMVVPVEVTSLDPLNHIRDLKLDWWWGNSDMKVPAALGNAPSVAGQSSGRTIVAMKSQSPNHYTTEIVVPKSVPANQLLWLQPNYESSAGRVYMQGVEKEVEPPPEARGTTLVFRPQVGTSEVQMHSDSRITGHDLKGEEHSARFNIVATLKEQTSQVNADGATMKVTFPKVEMGVNVDGRPPPKTKSDEQAFQSIGKATIDMNFDHEGNVFLGSPDLKAVPQLHQKLIEMVTTQVAHSLNFGAIPFPNGPVTVGQTWQGQRQLPVFAGDSNFTLVVDLTYTYKGIRVVNGREMAEVSLAGKLANSTAVSGTAVGKVLVDVAAGRVAKAHVIVMSTLSATILDETVQARSHLIVKYTRR